MWLYFHWKPPANVKVLNVLHMFAMTTLSKLLTKVWFAQNQLFLTYEIKSDLLLVYNILYIQLCLQKVGQNLQSRVSGTGGFYASPQAICIALSRKFPLECLFSQTQRFGRNWNCWSGNSCSPELLAKHLTAISKAFTVLGVRSLLWNFTD